MNIFLNKKILIYGIGKTGLSALKFFKNKAETFVHDDDLSKFKNLRIKNTISYKNLLKIKFDQIILSPGIDINNCKLSKFLKKNHNKIYSDLDVFYSFYKNDCITITGTNGKSTTCQLMYEVLLNQNYDVKLVGNIGNPILSAKNFKKKTIFIIEASSYQLEYSQLFKSKYAVILNLSPDHIERHKTLDKYINAKFKLFKNQLNNYFAFVKKDDRLINKKLRFNRYNSRIIKVDKSKVNNFLKKINNDYFLSETNKENLSFILAISKRLNLKNNLLKKTVEKFKGLKFRQQIIYKKKYLTIINDSKSTSFSSSLEVLKIHPNIYWLIGGIHKKSDKFDLPKKYFQNIRAFIYGKNKKFFNKTLKKKIKYENFSNLKSAIKKVFININRRKFTNQTILFSPCAASFDDFKNFEERGLYFNKLIKKQLNEI